MSPELPSTSAELRAAQRALAASQADLTRALAERDEARACWSTAERDVTLLRAELASANQELTILRIQLAGVVHFASAYDGSDRAWQVARQTVGPCGLCDQTIGRGHAVEPMPGAAGYFQHAAGLCPDKEAADV